MNISLIAPFIIFDQIDINEFASTPSRVQLVSRFDKPGIAYVSNHELVILSKNGSIERRIKIPKNRLPLYITEDGTLITSTNRATQAIDMNAEEISPGPSYRFFGRNQYLFCALDAVSYLGERSTCTFQAYDLYSAIGISSSGDSIAYLRSSGTTSLLETSNLSKMIWSKGKEISPYVSDIGTPGIAPRINDIVFIDSKHIAFAGVFYSVKDLDKYNTWRKGILNCEKWKLGPSTSSSKTCYLFVTNIDSGATTAVCQFAMGSSQEFGDPVENTICISNDSKVLYIASEKNILTISSSQLLSKRQ